MDTKVLNIQADLDDKLRNIFVDKFEMNSDDKKDNMGYQAWAGFAVDVAIKVANIILAVKKPDSGRGFRAITDLTYQLSANEFWTKNAPVLVPVLTMVLNSHKDAIALIKERDTYQEYALYDKLIAGNETCGGR